MGGRGDRRQPKEISLNFSAGLRSPGRAAMAAPASPSTRRTTASTTAILEASLAPLEGRFRIPLLGSQGLKELTAPELDPFDDALTGTERPTSPSPGPPDPRPVASWNSQPRRAARDPRVSRRIAHGKCQPTCGVSWPRPAHLPRATNNWSPWSDGSPLRSRPIPTSPNGELRMAKRPGTTCAGSSTASATTTPPGSRS